jgi:hypothetical protein
LEYSLQAEKCVHAIAYMEDAMTYFWHDTTIFLSMSMEDTTQSRHH